MKKVKIIAEIGVNHNGKISLEKKLIEKAKKCGADAVKFQNFTADNLAKINTKKVNYQKQNTPRKESHYRMLKRLELKKQDFKKIKKICDKNKIEFLSTPYDLESVELLQQLKVKSFKIASADLVDMILHKKIISTKKPVILSVGMANMSEIKKTVNFYKKKGMSKITLLHCVSNYPCSLESLNLKVILRLKKLFNVPIGFSDHSEGNIAAAIAVSFGATIIEKHFTLNKNLSGPDHLASCNPKEFSSYVKSIRKAEIMLGEDVKKCQPEEIEMKKISRKSITLKKAMKINQIVREKDIIMKRPGTGINGQKRHLVIGKKLKKNLNKDHQINFQDIA